MSVLHADDPVCIGGALVVMGYHDDGLSEAAPAVADQMHDLHAGFIVQISRRLI